MLREKCMWICSYVTPKSSKSISTSTCFDVGYQTKARRSERQQWDANYEEKKHARQTHTHTRMQAHTHIKIGILFSSEMYATL
eukprot:m.238916 g.238916  ORF g.238916 m.238916 type:complete len:83 (+) comp15288_c0_seq68:1569-1817(+)